MMKRQVIINCLLIIAAAVWVCIVAMAIEELDTVVVEEEHHGRDLQQSCQTDNVPAECGCNKAIKVQRPGCDVEQVYVCSTYNNFTKVRIGSFSYCQSQPYKTVLFGEGFCSTTSEKGHALEFYNGEKYLYITGYIGSGLFKVSENVNQGYYAKIGNQLKKWYIKGGSKPIYLTANKNTCSKISWYVVHKGSLNSGLIYPDYLSSGEFKQGCSCPLAF